MDGSDKQTYFTKIFPCLPTNKIHRVDRKSNSLPQYILASLASRLNITNNYRNINICVKKVGNVLGYTEFKPEMKEHVNKVAIFFVPYKNWHSFSECFQKRFLLTCKQEVGT